MRTNECISPPRELARRMSGTDEVLLLWRPAIDRVELSVRDSTTGEGFRIEVAAGNALDAFYHPYVYAAKPANGPTRDEWSIDPHEWVRE